MSISYADFWGYMAQLGQGTLVTVQLFLSAFALSLLCGVVVGVVTLSRNPLIFLLYYGGSAILAGIFGMSRSIDVTPFGAGLAALTLVNAAYIAELVHGAVRNLPRGQFEACAALSIRPWAAWWYVLLPQVIRLALPGLVNIWLIVLKETPLVSLAGLNDLVANAKIAAGATKEPFIFFIAAALFFIVVSALTMPLSRRLETRFGRGQAPGRA
jgi:polar amino acid transport system permease protein